MEKGALLEMLGGMRFQTTLAITFFLLYQLLLSAVVCFLFSFSLSFLFFVYVVFAKM